ncbi:hypothetical protein [uncultured Aquitalea sp.]|uniref:hypothetical protein n=1 Tax=uncultured Aquitalea sp. TaxID=540272 RepID=UPI0025FD6653|nr:hypothetical protein [uncultured Aquitalea sp.]
MGKFWILPLALALAGCNWVNNVSGLSKEAHKALGAACRQTGRSLEECFRRNPEADTAAIYAGWREMNEYMSKNHLETMSPPDDQSGKGESSAPVKKPMAEAPASGNASAPAEGKASMASAPHLTNEEAEKAAKSDPQVAAVLSAIRKNGDAKPKNTHPSGEPDQKRLLNIIQKLNGNKPQGDGEAPPAGNDAAPG